MGVTKKPAVKAKTTRKVALNRGDVELAKHFNVPLETIAKDKLPKRGRPVGSTNKPRATPVDWEKLAKQLQTALAAEMKANDDLQALFEDMKSKVIIVEQVSFGRRLKFLFTGNL